MPYPSLLTYYSTFFPLNAGIPLYSTISGPSRPFPHSPFPIPLPRPLPYPTLLPP